MVQSYIGHPCQHYVCKFVILDGLQRYLSIKSVFFPKFWEFFGTQGEKQYLVSGKFKAHVVRLNQASENSEKLKISVLVEGTFGGYL